MNNSNVDVRSEKRLLGALVSQPNLILDIDGNIIRQNHFGHEAARCIYGGIKAIAEQDKNLGDSDSIDPIVLEEKVANLYGHYYDRNKTNFESSIPEICSQGKLGQRDLQEVIRVVLRNAIRRESNRTLDSIKRQIQTIDNPADIVAQVEQSTFDFTSNAFSTSDIVVLGENYEEILARREKEAGEGKLKIGLDTGFPNYNKCIGGGFRRGTINVVAARSKAGKSWFALQVADTVAKQGIPVLYMDTELDEELQCDRRCALSHSVPISQLEDMSFRSNQQKIDNVKGALKSFKENKVYYVDIKGWDINKQISAIRRFFAKYVGKRPDGKYNWGLVILDYLKLMKATDKGADKEYEALGYRMTMLHDLMGEYNNPMFALAQQNRDGLDKQDESTISGSDRIIYLCDNFSILSGLGESELALHQSEADDDVKVPNSKLKVVVCRHGPSTPGRGYISMYIDIRDPTLGHDEVCGTIQEGPIRTS